jgi:hypothetical protein
MSDEISTDTIADAAGEPEQASADGVTVRNRKISDIIETDRYLRRRSIASNPAGAITRVQIVPPGNE